MLGDSDSEKNIYLDLIHYNLLYTEVIASLGDLY